MQKSDIEIVKQVVAGETDAFEILVQRYQQKIFSYIYRFVHENYDAAIDITQTVFLKAFQNLTSLDLEREFSPWIYRIAHNESSNHFRSITRRKENYLESDEWQNIASEKSQDKLLVEEQSEKVRVAVDSLTSKYRDVIQLFYYEEHSYEEIAQILNIPRNTVGTLVNRAKKQLAIKLQSYIDSPQSESLKEVQK